MDLISVLILLIGVTIGILLSKIIRDIHTVTGVVQIDHKSGLCRFCINRNDLSNPKCRKVIFSVEHNAKITDEEYENSQ